RAPGGLSGPAPGAAATPAGLAGGAGSEPARHPGPGGAAGPEQAPRRIAGPPRRPDPAEPDPLSAPGADRGVRGTLKPNRTGHFSTGFLSIFQPALTAAKVVQMSESVEHPSAACASPLTCCDGECVDTLANPFHCNHCNNPCDLGLGICCGGRCCKTGEV